MGNQLKGKAEKKISQRNHNLTKIKGYLQRQKQGINLNELMIERVISLTANQLVNLLNKSEITSQIIVLVYCLRAIKVGTQFNLITQDNFMESLQTARRCDQYRKESRKTNWVIGDPWDTQKFLPPLFGIPTSVKDTIDMNGFSSTIGCINRINKIQSDGTIMKCFRNSGMIPFVRTNVPQLAMTFQSNNNLWGRSLNPWNKQRAVGGSSGGEAALIAAKGSVIGVGSDIGGSLRIPAQFCGIFSLKPNSNRLSYDGHNSFSTSFSGNSNVLPSMGPLGRCVDDLALWMKTILSEQFYNGEHDPYVKLIPFDDKKYVQTAKNKKMRIGYINQLEFTQPTVASRRALMQTKVILQSMGHQLIEMFIPNQKNIIGCFLGQITAEGNLKTYKQILKGQKFIPEYKTLAFTQGLSWLSYSILNKIANCIQPRLGFTLQKTKKKNVYEYLTNAGMIKEYKTQFVNYMRTQRVDLIIFPGFGSQACKHGASDKMSMAATYTYIWNVLNLPAGSLPITVVNQVQAQYNSRYNDLMSKALKNTAQNSVGLPVGIQVIGMPYQEQKVLGLMKQIQTEVRFYQRNPLPKC